MLPDLDSAGESANTQLTSVRTLIDDSATDLENAGKKLSDFIRLDRRVEVAADAADRSPGLRGEVFDRRARIAVDVHMVVTSVRTLIDDSATDLENAGKKLSDFNGQLNKALTTGDMGMVKQVLSGNSEERIHERAEPAGEHEQHGVRRLHAQEQQRAGARERALHQRDAGAQQGADDRGHGDGQAGAQRQFQCARHHAFGTRGVEDEEAVPGGELHPRC